MKIGRLYLTVLLVLISCSLSFGATKEPPFQPQILNVVLVEIDTGPASKISKPIVNDWGHWDSQAGHLIARLRREFGHTLKTEKVKTADASLFAIQSSATGLGDTRGLAPVVKELDAITMHTGRASLVLVWLRREGGVLLGLLGTEELSGRVGFAVLDHLWTPSPPIDLLSTSASAYVMPPCVLIAAFDPASSYRKAKLDSLLQQRNTEVFLHCLAACDYMISLGLRLDGSRGYGPAGTTMLQVAWSAAKANPTQANVNQFIRSVRNVSPVIQQQTLSQLGKHAEQNPKWALEFDRNLSRGLASRNPIGQEKGQVRLSQIASEASKKGVFGGSFGEWARSRGGRAIGVIGGLFGDPVPKELEPKTPEPKTDPKEPKKWPPGSDKPPKKKGYGIGKVPKDRKEAKKSIKPKFHAHACSGINPENPPWQLPGETRIQFMVRMGWLHIYPVWEPPDKGLITSTQHSQDGGMVKLTQGPGGIMLAPELEITVDKQGLTSSTVKQALAAVGGNKTGGEITIDGKRTLVVRAPGSAKLFQVPVGKFQFQQQDVCIFGKDGRTVSLHRFYDSTSQSASSFGKGWSLLPYSLRIGYRKEVASVKERAARKPVLIDRQSGLELLYQLERQDDTAKTELPRYRNMTSSLQPELSLRSDGGYVATFAHGLEVTFDSNGQLQWIGSSESDRVNYIFIGQRLTSITGPAGKITLHYDSNGRLTAGSGSNGHQVTYRVVADKLEGVSGSESGSFTFRYGIDNRLAKATTELNAGERNLVFQNTYDGKGRVLTCRTSEEEWQYQYNDLIGRVIVNEKGGTQTEYYYDGNGRLVAYGSCHDDMTLLNYDATGRILQVAIAELINDPSGSQRPRFRVSKLVTPQVSKPQDRFYEEG